MSENRGTKDTRTQDAAEHEAATLIVSQSVGYFVNYGMNLFSERVLQW